MFEGPCRHGICLAPVLKRKTGYNISEKHFKSKNFIQSIKKVLQFLFHFCIILTKLLHIFFYPANDYFYESWQHIQQRF